MNFLRKNNAYIALSSVLVIAVIIVSISISATLLSISEGQMSLADQQQLKARSLAEGCIGEALLELKENLSLSSVISLPDGDCQISAISNNADMWNFELSASLNDYSSIFSIELSMDIVDRSISIISWKEL